MEITVKGTQREYELVVNAVAANAGFNCPADRSHCAPGHNACCTCLKKTGTIRFERGIPRVPLGEKYWTISFYHGSARIEQLTDSHSPYDSARLDAGNYFMRPDAAQIAADKINAVFAANLRDI